MRRRTAAGLAVSVLAPVLLASAGSTLLRLQASRLREEFDAAAPAPGTVLPVHREVVPAAVPEAAAAEAAAAGGTAPPETAPPEAALPEAALAVIGDSWLAGTGPEAPAALIAHGLAAVTGSAVRLSNCAVPSARAEGVSEQVDRVVSDPHLARAAGLRIAVVSMGTGDVVHPVTGSLTLGVLTSALTRLERAGFATVVLCCPNLSSLPAIRNPLRTVIRRSSRVVAGSQHLAALAAGALPLSTTRILSGTTRVGLVDPSGQRPSRLGASQLAAAVVSAIAERLAAPRTSVPRPEDPA
ncbi:hypothetical protein [Brevibacterium album]|uniref:hypothetical protein n=1 Tax=Brevibacterium album TaxID=417948 RepID=UPI000426CA5D|nr:hypothetical protein [Brevibacterium album]